MRAKFGLVPTAVSKILSFKFISRLGVRSLANASRARQFNPLNPPGVGTASSNKYGSRGRSCAVVHGRACMVGHAWSCAVVRGRAFVVGHSCVVHGRAWSCVVVPFCPLRGQHCRAARFVASTAVARTNERTTSNNPLNPLGWGGSIFCICLR